MVFNFHLNCKTLSWQNYQSQITTKLPVMTCTCNVPKVWSFSYWARFQNHLSLRDVLIGIISSECPLLNYFLLIAKLYLWDCRRSQILPSLAGFKMKIKIKFETEKYICTRNKTLDKFIKKWGTCCPT